MIAILMPSSNGFIDDEKSRRRLFRSVRNALFDLKTSKKSSFHCVIMKVTQVRVAYVVIERKISFPERNRRFKSHGEA